MPPRAAPTPAPASSQTTKKYQKATAKPPKPVPEQLKQHFNSLCAQIDGGHYKNAIKTCNKILRLEPTDKDALSAKLFLLIQTDQYESALEHVQQNLATGSSGASHRFEQAYLLYRLQKESEASGVLREIQQEGSDSRASMHLEAQIKYRQADYEGAREIYHSLLDSCPEDTEEHSDLVTNVNATQAHIDFFQSGYLTALNALETPVAALEEAGAPPIPSSSFPTLAAAASSSSAPQPNTMSAQQQQQKPPKKSRLPKHVVLGLTPMPDPERWLKKRERTSHRVEMGRGGRKGKRKEGMTMGSTQGVVLPAEKEVRASTPVGGGQSAKKGKKR